MKHNVMDILDIVGQLADLKAVDSKNTLAIAVLIDLLIDKGLFSRQEFAQKAQELESASLAEIIMKRRSELRTPRYHQKQHYQK
ncbi:hypothetical protein SOV_39490 [Sporomusa ovata DSM 2662]|uniref:Uncharacterized protein n=1 Tax=Sporomusa ovata TaxID=2378 RepID=A0A0U1KSM1_9FIRM|nr:hypothetical protein [Sporomusa ovata]EQB26336.1 hypothetical protein SOV_3c02100 [Sporomusa ovata DSM 2662]CQR70412.1 hypothetical protein SpAn4DRAFT_1381 [Sporomusa ovata]